MLAVTCFQCGHLVEISPDADRCGACGANLRRLISAREASHYFYMRAAEQSARGDVAPALAEVQDRKKHPPSILLQALHPSSGSFAGSAAPSPSASVAPSGASLDRGRVRQGEGAGPQLQSLRPSERNPLRVTHTNNRRALNGHSYLHRGFVQLILSGSSRELTRRRALASATSSG